MVREWSGSNFGAFSTEVVVLPGQLEVFVPLEAWQR